MIDPSSTTPAYATYLGGSDTDAGESVAVDANGLVYFAVTTDSTDFPLSIAPYRTTLQGVEDVAVGIVDPTQSGPNSLLYSTYFGGSDLDDVRKLAFDANGRVLLTGFTFSPDFPVTPDAVQKTLAGNGDVFVSVVDPLHPRPFWSTPPIWAARRETWPTISWAIPRAASTSPAIRSLPISR